MIKTGRVGRIIIACLMTVVLTVVGVHINKKINALAFTTNAAVISDILGKDVGDVTKEKVLKVVERLTYAANLPARGGSTDGLPDNVVKDYENYYHRDLTTDAINDGRLEVYCDRYETYLYGDGEFVVYCTFKIVDATDLMSTNPLINGMAVSGSLDTNGNIVASSFDELYWELKVRYSSFVGDPGEHEESDGELEFHDPAEDFENTMTEDEQETYDEFGTLTFREDPEAGEEGE